MVQFLQVKTEINWWVKNLESKNGKKIREDPISMWIQTDASNSGWGAFLTETSQTAGGRWSSEECHQHINYLELLAIFFALKSWCSQKRNIHIAVQSDNTTAISYINYMGGMCSLSMDNLSKIIWDWCLERDLLITAFYLSGSENIHADFSSRHFSDTTEWKLKPTIFKRLINQSFRPDIDFFASRLNAQLECYISWTPDPYAWAVDAFSVSWSTWLPYISVLLQSLISIPVRLPRHKDLLQLMHNGQLHPLRRNLRLIGTVVSGVSSRTEEFQKVLSRQSSTVGNLGVGNSIAQHGRDGHCGVILGTVIPFH